MQYQRLPRLLSFCFFLAVLQLSAVHARAADFSAMEGLTPREALELANEWRYTRSDMDKMYVDSREIVLVAKDGDELRLPLPEDEMVIAIAPYEQQTHT